MDRVERDYINNPAFRPESIRTKSSAAAGLCAWVINIAKYFRIYQASWVLVASGCLLADWLLGEGRVRWHPRPHIHPPTCLPPTQL